MAIVVDGGDTTVYTEVQWNSQFGSFRGFAVDGPNDCKVSTTTGQGMTTTVAAGTIYAHGSRAINDATVNVTHAAAPSSGTRYDLVVGRWDYSSSTSGGNAGLAVTFVAVSGGPTRAMPTRNRSKGVLVDQPLALVPISSGSASPGAPIDVRTWGIGPVHITDIVGIDPLDWPIGTDIRVGWGVNSARYEIQPSGTTRTLKQVPRPPITGQSSVFLDANGTGVLLHQMGWVPSQMDFRWLDPTPAGYDNLVGITPSKVSPFSANTATIQFVVGTTTAIGQYANRTVTIGWTAYEGVL